MAKTRTFIAVAASNAQRTRALEAIETLRSIRADIKWVGADALHWTLQFLGDLDDNELAQVCRRVEGAVREQVPFPLVAHGVGAFPTIARPRTLWLGAGEGGEALCRLQAASEKGLADLGFRGERRPFVPHLTLGRLGRGRADREPLARRLAELAEFDGETTLVDEVTVQASYLERSGPTYQVLARAKLLGDLG